MDDIEISMKDFVGIKDEEMAEKIAYAYFAQQKKETWKAMRLGGGFEALLKLIERQSLLDPPEELAIRALAITDAYLNMFPEE